MVYAVKKLNLIGYLSDQLLLGFDQFLLGIADHGNSCSAPVY